uniref:YLP motif-containing protein 1 n=1 Tax=Latimeria chalumnae TaxID=7897 RepID=H3BHW8_LATCH
MYPSWGRYGGAGHYPPSQMQQHYGGSQPVQQQQQPYGGSQPAQQHYASSAFQSFRQQHLEQLQQLQQMHQKQMQSVLLPPNHAEDWQASRGSAAGTMSYQQQQQALHHHQQSHHASPFDQQQEQPEPVSLPPPPQQQLQLPPLVSQQQHAQAGQLQHPPPVCQIQQQAAAPHHQSAPEAPASSDPQNQVQQQQVAPSINHAQMHPQANQTQLQQQPTVPVPISNNLPQQQGNSNEVPSSHQVQQRQLPQTDTSSMSLQEQQQYWYKMHLLSLQQKAKGQQQSQTAGRDKLSEAQQESKPPVPPPPQEPPRNEPPPPPPRDEPPPPLPPDEPKNKPKEDSKNPEEEQRLKQLQAAAAQWQQQQQQRVGYQYQAMMQQHAQLRQLLQQYQQLIQNPPHLHTMSIDMQLRHYEMQQQQFTVLYQQWERQFQQWQDHLQSYPHKDQLQNYKNQWIQWQEQMKTTKSHLLDRVEALKNIKQQYMSNPYMGSVPTMPPYVHYPPPQVGVTTPPLITGSTSAVPSIPQITGPSLPLKLPPISVPQEASVTGGPQAQMSPQVPLAQQAPPVTSVSSEKEQLEPPAKKESPPIAAASSSSSSSSTVTVTTTTTTAAAASSSTFTNTLTTPSGPVPSTGLLGVRPSKPAPDPAKSMQSEGSRLLWLFHFDISALSKWLMTPPPPPMALGGCQSCMLKWARFDGPCGRGASTVDGPRVRLEGPRPRAPWFEGQQLEGPRSRFEGQHLEGPPTHSGEPPTRPSLLGPGPRPPLLETPRGPIPRLNQSRGIPPLMSGPQACGPRWRTPRPLFGQAEEKIQPAAEKKEPLQEAPQKPEFEDKTLPVQHTQYDSKVKKDALGSRDSLTPERPPKFITKVQNQEAPQKTEGAVNTETIAAGTNVVLKPSDTLDQKPVAVAESPTTLITTSTKSTTVTSASSSSAPFVPEYKNSEPLDLKPPHPEFRQEKGPGRGRGSSRNMNRRNQNVAGFNKRPPLLSDEPGGLKHHGKNEGQKQVIVDKGKGGPLLEREKFEHWKQEIPLREPELDFDDPYRREERPLLRRPMFPHEERWDHESGPYDLDHNRDLDRFGRPHDYPGREFDQEFYRLEDRDLHERRDFPPFPPQIPMNRFREERWREDRTRESYEKDLRDRGELQIWEYPERPEFRRDYYEPEKFDWERERIEDDRQFPPDLENRRFPPDNRQFPPDLEDRRFITETPETDQPVSIGGVVALSQRQHEIILKAAQELKMLREQQEKQQKFKDGEPGAPSVGRLAEGGIPGLDTDTSEMDLQPPPPRHFMDSYFIMLAGLRSKNNHTHTQKSKKKKKKAQPATTESAVAPAIVEPVSDPSVERWDTDSFQGLWDSTSDKVDDPGLGFPQQVLETEQLSTPAPALLPPLNTVPLPQQSLDYGHGRDISTGKEHIPYGERITLRPTPILERPYEKDHNIPRDRYERDLYLDRRGNLNTDRRDYDRDRELYRDRSVDYDRGDRYERDRHSRGRMPRVPSPRPPSYRDKDAYRRGGFDRPPYERAPDRPPYDHGPPVYGGERHGYSDERIPVPAPGPAPPLHPQPALPPPRVEKKPEMKNVDDILKMPGRQSRPERIVVIMRGLPGSGKTHVAKLIRDKEVEFGGAAPRVLSLDDYFMTEVEKTEKDPDSGKRIKKKVLEYEYEPEMEETYRNSMFKSFRKTLDDGFFPFIILDAINDRVKHFQQFWSAAKTKGFEVYIAEMSSDNQTCAKRNIHGRKLKDITKMAHHWETAPRHMMRLDIRSLLQDAAIEEVEMEDFDPNAEQKKEEEKKETVEEEESDLGYIPKSKWEMDTSEAKLDKLDGIRTGNKRKRGWESIAQRMEDYLQLPDDYATRASEPGKKRVRWADLEEKKDADRKRAIGFVVGQTDWEKITDETGQLAERALNRTKYF